VALYSALLPLVELNQWYRNGDHPDDRTINRINTGRVVGRHFSMSDPVVSKEICKDCDKPLGIHGFLNKNLAIQHPTTCYVICPGDYIRTHRDPNTNRIVGYTTLKRVHVESFYELYKGPIPE
jgi:hypothetical protein